MTVLQEIVAHKWQEIDRRKREKPLSRLASELQAASAGRDFAAVLSHRRQTTGYPALIAEIKRASPSRGSLAPGIDVLQLARIYQQNGAAALSVLTDEKFFQGSLDDLQQVTGAGLGIPVLRKDFILDEYQLLEARQAGADGVLLIVAALSSEQLRFLQRRADELGLAALVEVHNRVELEIALVGNPRLLGINNRDLHTFTTHLQTTIDLARYVPPEVILVAESGIHTPEDVTCLAQAGVHAILVGEALVTASDVAAKVRSLSA